MAKYAVSNETYPISANFVAACTPIPIRYHGVRVDRVITGKDMGDSRVGGLVIDPVRKEVTGIWAWDIAHEPNVRFCSYKEVDQNGQHRLFKGSNPVCNSIREFILRNGKWSA